MKKLIYTVLVLCVGLIDMIHAGSCLADSPRMSIDIPSDQPVYITFGPAVGGTPGYAAVRPGCSGSFLFRPAPAAQLMRRMFDWNTGIVLHGEYRSIDSGRDLYSATFVFRKYISDMRSTGAGPSLFAGAGSGLALASYPGGAANPRAENRYLSFLAEVGYEFNPAPDIVLVAKAHWRNYIWQSLDYSGWSVHFQVGIPIPW